MPNNGSNKGVAFSTSKLPPGLSGANIDSHAKHSKISAIKLTVAPKRKFLIMSLLP